MPASSAAFHRYVEAARNGREGLWRIVVGAGLILVLWAGTTVAAFLIGIPLSDAVRDPTLSPEGVVSRFLSSPIGVLAALASFIGAWPGVYLAVRFIHRRPFGTVLGASGRLAWGDLLRGLIASLIASGLAEAATFFVDPTLQRSALGLGAWLLWTVPTTLLLFVQISAEELCFRGYLVQALAARFRSPLIWAVIPVALFTALHLNTQTAAAMSAATLLSIAAFAVLAMALLLRTGNLAAGMGAHLGLNLFGVVFVSHMSWLSGSALYESQPLDIGAWSGWAAFMVGALGIGSFALMYLLLVHPRSPLRVGEA